MTGVPFNRYVIFSCILIVGCAADLATKSWIFSWPELRLGATHWLWPNHAGLQLSWNEGALFGMGQGMVWLFAALSMAAAVAIPLWLFKFGAASDIWATAALGCVMAGVFGNLYDRLGLHGESWPLNDPRAGKTIYAVRDWILIQASDQWRWPNFNIADSLLVVGAGLLFARALLQTPQESGALAAPEIER